MSDMDALIARAICEGRFATTDKQERCRGDGGDTVGVSARVSAAQQLSRERVSEVAIESRAFPAKPPPKNLESYLGFVMQLRSLQCALRVRVVPSPSGMSPPYTTSSNCLTVVSSSSRFPALRSHGRLLKGLKNLRLPCRVPSGGPCSFWQPLEALLADEVHVGVAVAFGVSVALTRAERPRELISEPLAHGRGLQSTSFPGGFH
jgi:hypothetical protein